MGRFHPVAKSIFPGPPGDIECGVVRPVNTMNGDFLGDAEARSLPVSSSAYRLTILRRPKARGIPCNDEPC